MELLNMVLETEKVVEKIYYNDRERKSFLIVADKCGYKDKIPNMKSENNPSSIAGYIKRFNNWKNKLMIAYTAQVNYNSSKVLFAR